jgi:hypothetical protein
VFHENAACGKTSPCGIDYEAAARHCNASLTDERPVQT